MLNFTIEDGTKALGLARALNSYVPPFRVAGEYKLIDNGVSPEATVHVFAQDREIHEASNGSGHVDALENVLRQSLSPIFPEVGRIKLVD